MTRGILPTMALAVASAAVGTGLGAQQVLEIDLTQGREILNDEMIGLFGGRDDIAVDHTRKLLYASTWTNRMGVEVLSLATGEWLRTLSTQRGGGPTELPQGLRSWAVRRSGGIYLADMRRVIEVDSAGNYVSTWQPDGLDRLSVCEMADEPAVPVQWGVVVRDPADHDDIWLGPDVVRSSTFELPAHIGGQRERAFDYAFRLSDAKIACTDDRAFVVMENEAGPDSIYEYRVDGTRRAIQVPDQFSGEVSDQARGLVPKTDGRGNLFLVGRGGFVVGALIDPSSGCHAALRVPLDRELIYDMVGKNLGYPTVVDVYADSAVVTYMFAEMDTSGGRTVLKTQGNQAFRVALHPLQRVSGDPCPGMLPSVR